MHALLCRHLEALERHFEGHRDIRALRRASQHQIIELGAGGHDPGVQVTGVGGVGVDGNVLLLRDQLPAIGLPRIRSISTEIDVDGCLSRNRLPRLPSLRALQVLVRKGDDLRAAGQVVVAVGDDRARGDGQTAGSGAQTRASFVKARLMTEQA